MVFSPQGRKLCHKYITIFRKEGTLVLKRADLRISVEEMC